MSGADTAPVELTEAEWRLIHAALHAAELAWTTYRGPRPVNLADKVWRDGVLAFYSPGEVAA